MVVLGVDPHKHSHTVVAVDEAGRRLGQLTVSARAGRDGQLRLLGWARQPAVGGSSPVSSSRLWAVEDGRHVAGRLVEQLLVAGERVVWVPPKLMANSRASARTPGKSDPIDALAVARAALREPDLPVAVLPGPALGVRLLLDHREDLVAERTRMINRLRWHLHDLDPELAPPARALDRGWVLDRLAAQLLQLQRSQPQRRVLGVGAGGVWVVRAQIAAELVGQIRQLTERIDQLERDLAKRVAPLSGRLRRVVGVGALTAAKLIGHTGGACRFGRSARFAMHAGVAPIPVWSANQTRHRLNRGGNRQLNAAIHRVAVTQLRAHPPARALVERRIGAGDTKPEALRVLKRHLADVLFAALCADEQAASVKPAGQPAAA
jgi:transposase